MLRYMSLYSVFNNLEEFISEEKIEHFLSSRNRKPSKKEINALKAKGEFL